MIKEGEEKTTFYKDHGAFCYTKMSFDLKNVETPYQHLVYSIFAKQIVRNIEVYINDMVMKIPYDRRLLEDMEETFKTLENVRMKLKPRKCTFGFKEGEFLGYYVTTKGIQPSLTKVKELMVVPSPHMPRVPKG